MSPVKKFAMGASALMALGVIGVVGYGYTLDPVWHVERSALIGASTADIHPYVESPANWKRWAMGQMAADSGTKIETFGPEAGPGSGYSWEGTGSNGRLTLDSSAQATGVAYTMVMEGTDRPAHGSIRYAPEGEGTRVTWSDEGDFGKPFGGFMVSVMAQQLGDHLDRSLATLGGLAEADAAKREAEEAAAAAAAEAAEAPAENAP